MSVCKAPRNERPATRNRGFSLRSLTLRQRGVGQLLRRRLRVSQGGGKSSLLHFALSLSRTSTDQPWTLERPRLSPLAAPHRQNNFVWTTTKLVGRACCYGDDCLSTFHHFHDILDITSRLPVGSNGPWHPNAKLLLKHPAAQSGSGGRPALMARVRASSEQPLPLNADTFNRSNLRGATF